VSTVSFCAQLGKNAPLSIYYLLPWNKHSTMLWALWMGGRFSVRIQGSIQGMWWHSLEVSWVINVTCSIWLWVFEALEGNYQMVCVWKRVPTLLYELWGKWDFVKIYGFYEKMLLCPIFFSSLSNFQWEIWWKRDYHKRTRTFLLRNELSHSWLIGSWEETVRDMIPWGQ
jgi:hypothetical protein